MSFDKEVTVAPKHERHEFFITSGAATQPRFPWKPNQDAYLELVKQNAFGVFDGLGGNSHGDAAAQIARNTIQAHIKTIPAEAPPQIVGDILRAAFADADQRIRAEGMRLGLPREHTPNTTATVFVILGKTGIIAHCGDSRLYCLRQGNLMRITEDDSALRMPQIAEILKENDLTAHQVDEEFDHMTAEKDLSPTAAVLSAYRHVVTNTLGTAQAKPTITEFEVESGDVYLLCTDGVENLTRSEIAETFTRTSSPAIIAQMLVHNAAGAAAQKRFRAHADDATALVVKVG